MPDRQVTRPFAGRRIAQDKCEAESSTFVLQTAFFFASNHSATEFPARPAAATKDDEEEHRETIGELKKSTADFANTGG